MANHDHKDNLALLFESIARNFGPVTTRESLTPSVRKLNKCPIAQGYLEKHDKKSDELNFEISQLSVERKAL